MIHEKPFSFEQMLRRTVFLGRPNFFNAKDLNKEFETIHNFMEEFNKAFAVTSKIQFTFNTFGETVITATTPATVERNFHFNWTDEPILYKGVKFFVGAGGMAGEHIYDVPDSTSNPKGVKPPTYIVLKSTLATLDFTLNPDLCGITSDESPTAVSTVKVEQYTDVEIAVSTDLSEDNIICILGTIHPRYKTNGDSDGFGMIMNTFKNEYFTINNGLGNATSNFQNNGSLFEYVVERFSNRYRNVLNERQLIRRFDLADLQDTLKARHNIGFSDLVNRRQLVQAENLFDIPDKARARYNLGLGDSATRNIGTTLNDVARGDIIKIGMVVMWFGAPSQVPDGWKQCNGVDGTPDMRGRFPVGYDQGNNAYLMGSTGGAEKIKLTGAESGTSAHNHTLNDPGHRHTFIEGFQTDDHGNGDHAGSRIAKENRWTSTETTGITISATTAQDATAFHENRPPYFSLMFIIYVGFTIPPPTALPAVPALTYPNFSTPTNGVAGTDSGYSLYDFDALATSGNIDLGAGVILTNPE